MVYNLDDDSELYVSTGVGGDGDVFTPEGFDLPPGTTDGGGPGSDVQPEEHVRTYDGKDDHGNDVHVTEVETHETIESPANSNEGLPGDEDPDSGQDDSDVTDPQSDESHDGDGTRHSEE